MDWVKILCTFFIFSFLSSYYSVANGFIFDVYKYSPAFLKAMIQGFFMVFAAFMVTALPFHLYALQKSWIGEKAIAWQYYSIAGMLAGTAVAAIYALPSVFTVHVFSFFHVIFFAFATGGFAGFINGYSFWAFVVGGSYGSKLLVTLLWFFMCFPFEMFL